MSERKYLPEGGLLQTSENRERTASYAALAEAMESGAVCEALAVRCDCDMSLTVELGAVRGIIPREEAVYCAEGEEIKNIAVITRVGKPVAFKILSLNRDEYGQATAVLSRRAAQKECYDHFISTLTPGDIIDARVTHLEHFGAFVDIGCGIVSLLSIDCISVSRISHPRDRFRPGMSLRAVVKSVDPENRRIYVSHKELLGSWEENAAAFAVGQTVAGIVRSIEDYGVFIELTPNLAGLAECREDFELTIGSSAAVYIKSIIPERMKIKLVLIDSYKSELIPVHNNNNNYYYNNNNFCFNYFIGDERPFRLERWRYSPLCCERVIETVFDGQA